MTKLIKGTFLETDPSIKQIILKLNDTRNFLIEDINDGSLFIESEREEEIREYAKSMLSK